MRERKTKRNGKRKLKHEKLGLEIKENDKKLRLETEERIEIEKEKNIL